MSKDGYILEQLIKQYSEYELHGCKLKSNVEMIFDNIDYTRYVKIRRMIKRMKCGVIMHPVGDLDTINLLDSPKTYKITLEKAFEVLKANNKQIGCSLTFIGKRLKWSNR